MVRVPCAWQEGTQRRTREQRRSWLPTTISTGEKEIDLHEIVARRCDDEVINEVKLGGQTGRRGTTGTPPTESPRPLSRHQCPHTYRYARRTGAAEFAVSGLCGRAKVEHLEATGTNNRPCSPGIIFAPFPAGQRRRQRRDERARSLQVAGVIIRGKCTTKSRSP